ncbi:type I restriction enzyme M protein [Candidatus Kryptonium thompsonii]|jgi:type I restriction enzyme M protein|uniref:site-specific DNA-methyltransferase (adenine-specific) n=3 Tax=Candidatus Kryptonium thompsonii TaxID=1633631 RepID=A0A0P1NVQ6_9BACT|nr:class I SAM-dependent DNA methyltransferase [Candidatus Kryptonium thompsoni]CUS80908.1 type I restriction enzyme M protein [Candidatus Kryptonium thompsoni]CUS84374.1 type I restriction enzyme M protein [Candidatus Kryptonium thompsoni]CUS86344.1 type I restriction enzyme M protein [Candidatus Kryptonium thompsoni]CUS92044.1 type I restriction enzyme M protein [Candidatus Kryptonium thompsoni]CUS94396.1 type I restriction enzyme M protein [Candidatus Kryptonium thompsoni]
MNNRPQTRETLANEIWRACDILRRDNNCGGIMEYVEHLSWLLFLRFLDAQEEEWETQAKLAGREYRPTIESPYRWRDWAMKDYPADELLSFVHGKLIPYLQSLGGDPLRDTIRGVFAERNVIVCASGYNLKDVISIINSIDFHSQDDIFTVSQVYEELLRRLGNENRMAGEFYTPRPVVRFIVELVNPQIGETVYDPACGTCGFLAEAYLWMKRQEKTIEDHKTLQEQTFFGQEKKPIPALLGLMNMVLHGVTAPKVYRKNTLEENIRQVTQRFDVIMTNPPFGGTEGRHIQQNFPVQSQATELLFLQHIMKKLKPRNGARCGMVVPDGMLSGGGAFAEVKRTLLEEFNLHTIVSLPIGTFAPYSDVKTALIFFERPGPTKEIWYYELPLPEGLKKFSKGNPIKDEHFEEARKLWKAWDAYRKGQGPRESCLSERSWIVSIEDIKNRGYDLTARNPNRKETESLPSPVEIVVNLLEREQEILSIVEELNELLGNNKEGTEA